MNRRPKRFFFPAGLSRSSPVTGFLGLWAFSLLKAAAQMPAEGPFLPQPERFWQAHGSLMLLFAAFAALMLLMLTFLLRIRATLLRRVEEKNAALHAANHSLQTPLQEHERTASYQELLAELARQFLHLPCAKTDAAISDSLQRIGEFFQADLVSLIPLGTPAAPAIQPRVWKHTAGLSNPGQAMLSSLPELHQLHQHGKPIQICDPGALEPGPLRDHLTASNIQQFLSVPLMDEGKCVGAVCAETASDTTVWTRKDQLLLHLFADLLMNLMRRQRGELALIRARDEADRSNAAKSRFLAIMSHELRTPMNGILGMAQLLLDDPASPPQAREYGQIILRSGQSLLALLNDILDLSKIEAGRLELDTAPFSPSELLLETEALFRNAAKSKSLSLCTCWSGPGDLLCLGDSNRVRQMLNNLVNNAIKFSTSGTIRLDGALLGASPETGPGICTLEFSVTDSGPGITEEDQKRLFQPFSQLGTSELRPFGGTGLGLSIVKSLSEAMGGEVGVTSDPGQGARFWFRVRLPEIQGAEAPWRETPAESADKARPLTPIAGRALIVEDNLINQMVLENILKRLGLQTEIAEQGEEALHRVQDDPDSIDLILMDIQMPVMDGYTATRKIRAWEQSTGRTPIPILALTADAFPEDRVRCFKAGMDGYLSKPVDPASLHQLLQQTLSKAETLQSSQA